MCGIFGFISSYTLTNNPLQRGLDAVAHRGPDDEGIFEDIRDGYHIGLGTRRLSIIDVEAGHQPISNEDGTLWLTYNGEIYNYIELRNELEYIGHRFRTRTDSEVIFHAYQE